MIVASLWLASISLGQQGRMIKDFGLVAVSLFGADRGRVRRRQPGAQGGREAHRLHPLLQAGRAQPSSSGASSSAWRPRCSPCSRAWRCSSSCSPGSWPGARRARCCSRACSIYLQLLVVMAVTICFSTMSSAILASVLGICVFAAGQLSHNVLSLSRLGHSGVAQALSVLVFYLVPNLSAVDVKAAVVGEGGVALDAASPPGAATCSPTLVIALLRRPPGSSGARSSEVRLLRVMIVAASSCSASAS